MRNLLMALVLGSTSLLPARADAVDIQLLTFNDFHSSLPSSFAMTPEGPVEAGGAEYLAAHMDRLQKDNPHGTLRLAAGDNIISSPASAVMNDEPAIQALNLMRLDASSVGNHEFDRGLSELRRLENGGCHPIEGCSVPGFKGASFPLLGANIVDTTTGKPAFDPYLVKEVRGVKVGIIGLTHKNSLFEAPSPTAPLEGRDEAETVNAYVAELKAKGVHTIVVLLHQGGGQTGGGLPNQCNNLVGPVKDIVAKLDPEVDAVVSAHTHNAYNCTINGIPVTQTSGFSREVTRINLTVDRATGNPVTAKAENITVTHDIKPYGPISVLRRKSEEEAHRRLDKPVGMITGDLTAVRNAAGESTMGHALADARLFATSAPENGGAQIAVQPPYGGGIGGDLVVSATGNDLPNLVTHGEAMRVQQFRNNLVTMTLTGTQVERLLEQQWCGQKTARVLGVSQGLTYTYDNAKPACDRIDPATVKLNGTVVDPAAKYRLTANSFIASGGDGFSVLTEGTERVEKIRDIEAFESYLRARSPLAAPALGRVTRVN
ncbi:bifunctional metallophosphatase/5'-nucleotidase [Nonomuraea sp. SMC257]|uniref:Bifunctional metallophosphatase/5'-nucleotidase n=1 Tax=Nonomuraea montanisoli TaxID=2741721 RepID=A0A7Y6I786_9ACTN|nr:bifunctional metallophosphatase/5'-nucleotidase [Nonomuraea montanisoli]NUW32983.1 bifunctional metallophosphatase/5'-nucleotidase [Nonomuraea montanisoli]